MQDAVGKDKEVVDAIAVDITFQNKDGKEIEPAGNISVSMFTSRAVSGESHQVLHIDDNGNASQVTNASADGASFAADSFSIYVITGSGDSQQPAVATYVFYGEDNKTVISTQKVKSEETLYSPDTPEKAGYVFQGWSTEKDEDTAAVEPFVSMTIDTVSKTETISYYPVFAQKLYVFFMDDQDRVWATKEGMTGDAFQTSDVKLALDSTQSVTGWYYDEERTKAVESGTVTLADRNITLWPKVETGHYLYFSTGSGASYVDPEFVAADEVTTEPAQPIRPGYTFLRWSLSENGDAYTFGNKISGDTMLYAVWQANNDTGYTVIYWKQSVNDSKDATDGQKTYDYAGSASRKGTTGRLANPNSADRNKGYTGFTYNSAKSASVTIAGDGTTVLNVYYDRNKLTINFYITRRQQYPDKTFTGLYGQTLAQNGYEWPDKLYYDYYEYDCEWWNRSYNSRLTFLDAFIFDDLPEYGTSDEINLYAKLANGKLSINHYKQNLDGSYSYSSPANSSSGNGGTWTFTNKYTGFTVDSYVQSETTPSDSSRWKGAKAGNATSYSDDLYIRYSRNSYQLAYYNYNATAKEEKVLYEAPLSGYNSYTPGHPSGLPDAYTFQGWYKDKECTVPFDFNETMPANDVIVYAKWDTPSYKGTVHLTIDGTGDSLSIEIPYGGTIIENNMPTVKDADGKVLQAGSNSVTVTVPRGHSWAGWSTKEGDSYIKYNFNSQVYGDIVLYPYYVNTEKFTVNYAAGGGTGSVTDNLSYAENSYAEIKSSDGITPPQGKTFLYWADDRGTKYYPGSKVKIIGNLTLTAVFGDTAGTTSLVYHSNYPAGSTFPDGTPASERTVTVADQANNTILSLAEVSFVIPSGYYFSGWTRNADGTGEVLTGGQSVVIDNTTSNELYAKWETVKEITLIAKSKTAVYDGRNQSASGVYNSTFLIRGSEYTVSGFTTEDPSKKNAGTYSNNINGTPVVKDSDGNDVTYQFKVTTVNGKLTITKREVTLTSATDSKTYDGTALTNHEVTVGGDGFADGEGAAYTVTGSQTETGSSPNSFTYVLNNSTRADNYEITKKDGTLTVNPVTDEVTVKITGNTGTALYDGQAHVVSGYTYSISGSSHYTEEDFSLKDGVIASVTRTAAGTYQMGLTADSFQNHNSNFTNVTFAVTDGTLTIGKRSVIMTSGSGTKTYDGAPLTNHSVTVTGDGFVSGEGADYTYSGSQTAKGSSKNTFTYTLKEGTSEDNYNIKTAEGDLVVTAAKSVVVQITGNSSTVKYSGKEQTVTGYTAVSSNENYTSKDFSYRGRQTAAGTEAGSYQMGLSADSFTNTNDNFEDVTFKIVQDGTLTIQKRDVTLTSATGSKTYDGTPLTNDTVTVSGDDFAEGEGADYHVTGTITDAGTVPNSFDYTLKTGTKAANYNISCVEGKLTVNPVETAVTVNIEGATGAETYSGTEQSVTGYDVTSVSNPLYKEEYAVLKSGKTATAAGTDAGSYPMGLNADSFENSSRNFKNVTFEVKDGSLTISPRQVTLTSASDSKTYDGLPLTAPAVSESGDSFVEGEVSNIRATGTITKVGSTTNTIAFDAGTEFKEGNYTITKKEGTLTIRKYSDTIKVVAGSASKTYDGTPLTDTNIEVTGLIPVFTLKANVSGAITDKGKADNEITDVRIFHGEEDVTDQFDSIETAPGTLEIFPRKVTLTSKSDSRMYDGKELTAPDVEVSGEGFVDGEVSNIRATGKITDVGSIKNKIEYTAEGTFKADNYVITLEEGDLVITRTDKTFVITAASAKKKYDGTPLTASEVTVTKPSGFENYTVETAVSGEVTDVAEGEVPNVISSVVIRDPDGRDVTEFFYEIERVDGALKVLPREITLTSASASKEYDGTALTAQEVTVSGDGFADGEGASYTFTGSQTEVGQSQNVFTYKLNTTGKSMIQNLLNLVFPKINANAASDSVEEKGGVQASNYDIEVVYGTLTVTAKSEPVPEPKEEEGGTPAGNEQRAVAVYKVDAQTGAYLSGAQFALYSANGSLIGTYETNEQGFFKVPYLTDGSYYFVETSAPEGYALDQNKVNFELDKEHSYSNDYPWNIKVANRKLEEEPEQTADSGMTGTDGSDGSQASGVAGTARTGYAAPMTGDDSSMGFYGWIALIAAAGMMGWLAADRKRRKNH